MKNREKRLAASLQNKTKLDHFSGDVDFQFDHVAQKTKAGAKLNVKLINASATTARVVAISPGWYLNATDVKSQIKGWTADAVINDGDSNGNIITTASHELKNTTVNGRVLDIQRVLTSSFRQILSLKLTVDDEVQKNEPIVFIELNNGSYNEIVIDPDTASESIDNNPKIVKLDLRGYNIVACNELAILVRIGAGRTANYEIEYGPVLSQGAQFKARVKK